MSVAIISAPVGKSPSDIRYSFVFDEALGLSGKGVVVHLITSRIEPDSISYGLHFHGLEKIIDPISVESLFRNFLVYPLASFPRKPTTIYWENLYATNVCRVIKNNRIDLIHAHFAYPEGLVGLLAKKRTGKRLIVTVHGYDILTESSVQYGVRLDKKIGAIVSRVLNSADAVIAASNATFKEVCKIVNETGKVHMIPNGVDTEKFNPNLDCVYLKRKLGVEKRTVIFALRGHEPQYGLEYLIRAASIVTKKEDDVLFVIGGDGSLRHYHEQLAVKLGVSEKMVFSGKIPRNEVPYYYAMSDMVVVPSIQEAFGLVVSEAMSCGKPVIGTNVGGIPDQIINGHNGFLVKPKNASEIAERILCLMNNPQKAKRMGMNGRKIVEEKFNIERRLHATVCLYERLLLGCS